MHELCFLQNKRDEWSKTGLVCSLNYRHSITIPVKIRQRLSFISGTEVAVSATDTLKEIMIRELAGETSENIMVISDRGAIRIPIELKRAMRLVKGSTFHVFISKNEKAVLLARISSSS